MVESYTQNLQDARLPSGQKIAITTSLEATVVELKVLISLQSALAPDSMRLVVKGRILKDDQVLSEYQINSSDTVHVAKSNPTPLPSPTVQESPKDDVMSQLGSNPMLQSLLSNPEFLQVMLAQDPRLAKMAEQHPEIRQAISDPSFLKDMSSAMQNPKLLQEMMRSQDRTLQNIESVPGGFTQLAAMFTSMNGPSSDTPDPSTEEANVRMAHRLGIQHHGNAHLPGQGPNTAALPNPWAAPAVAGSSALQIPIIQTPLTHSLPVGNTIPSTANTINPNPMMQQLGMLQGVLGQHQPPSSAQPPNAVMEQMAMLQGMIGQQPSSESNLQSPHVMMQQMSMMQSMIGQQASGTVAGTQDPNSMMQQMAMMQGMMSQQQATSNNSQTPNTFMQQMMMHGMLARQPGTQAANMQSLLNPTQLPVSAPVPQQSVETQYHDQLETLQDMGFNNNELNKRAILAAVELANKGGNTEAAISFLLDQ